MIMNLIFGSRPFDFEDLFQVIKRSGLDAINKSYLEVLNKHLEAGFHHFEINADLHHVFPGMFSSETIHDLKTFLEKHDVTFSVHLPLWAIEPSAFCKKIRVASVDCLVDAINTFSPLNPTSWVLHLTGALASEFSRIPLPDQYKILTMKSFADRARESLLELLEKSGINSRTLAIENVEFPFKLYEPLLEELDLGVCFDTGHLLAGYSGDWDVMEFYEGYKDRIIEIHLHDGQYPGIDHQPLGKHDLPVKKFISTLARDQFQGPIVFELSLKDAIDSWNYIKKVVSDTE